MLNPPRIAWWCSARPTKIEQLVINVGDEAISLLVCSWSIDYGPLSVQPENSQQIILPHCCTAATPRYRPSCYSLGARTVAATAYRGAAMQLSGAANASSMRKGQIAGLNPNDRRRLITIS